MLHDFIKRIAIFVGAHVAFVALVLQAYAG
jgi:hypothetical protein